MGYSGGCQRQPKRKRMQQNSKSLQCYNCQCLGHTARDCKNAVTCLKCAAAHDTRSCTKPRGAASSCANCGGPHTANSRSCSYLRESRCQPAAPRPVAVSSAMMAALPPRSGEGCEPHRHEAATDDAMAGLQATFAAERATLKAELVAVHRQLQQLREELRVLNKKMVLGPTPASPAVRPVGIDAATQTCATSPPAAMQVVAPMETEDVTPGPPPTTGTAVLRGVTFTIPAGQLVAIVGPSGSGKTTCLRLMNGFYDPPQGTVEFCCNQGLLVLKVRVSGVDIRHVTGAWLRARIAFVQQKTTLLGATVADAIRFGVAGSDADVTDVAKIAGVHDVIDQMPKRYATPLSGNISDDVRKRLAIARALLTNPDILLLDSCFSSMAPEVEGALLSAITEARPECTVVVVTSRQKTLESASHIVVLESGVAVEEGSLLELLRQRQWLFQALRRAAEARSVDAVDAEEDDTIDEFEPAASELGPCPLQAEQEPHRRRASSDLGVEEVGVLAALGRSARLEQKDGERPQWGSVLRLSAREWPLLATGAVAAALCGLSLPVYAALFGECLALISVNPVGDIYKRLDFYTKIFLIAGCLSGTSLIVQGYTMAAAGSRLTKRLRQSLFDAMLHQELTWFEKEENDIDSLLHMLRVDAANVQKASGEQLALVVQLCSVVWASALLSLYYSWQLGALTLGLAPLLIYALLYLSKTVSRRPFDELEELNKAEAVSTQAIC
ncbi:bile salt export pump-like [Schistocerca serialis cubense]|uniref:bile salt export pump-like n=1 Tax=Schistocerca serialis cubense TaxID=2023355 RepID=UPI00214E7F39|nr:bile salt export pump-like [Schistocerca serialis cubense]